MDSETAAADAAAAGPDQEALAREIADLFAQEFRLAQVGLGDHFLFLGGDSLMAESLATAISSRFAIKVMTAVLLDAPTPRAMAAFLAERLAPGPGSGAVSSPGRSRAG